MAGGLANLAIPWRLAQQETKLLPVAALITAYYPVSHADVIASKILEGYQRNGGDPRIGPLPITHKRGSLFRMTSI